MDREWIECLIVCTCVYLPYSLIEPKDSQDLSESDDEFSVKLDDDPEDVENVEDVHVDAKDDYSVDINQNKENRIVLTLKRK